MTPVDQFVMEKLALPAWMRRLPGFIKGKPWQAWTGEARAAGKARARQHVTRKAIRESDAYTRAGLPVLAEKARAPLQGALVELGPLVQQVKNPQMRRLLTTPSTQGALWMDPLMRKTPSMRSREVRKLMEGPLQMSQRQAVRSAAGIGGPSRLGAMEAAARGPKYVSPLGPERAYRHMIPPKGQTGAFQEMFERAPTALQQSPRFQVPLDVVQARRVGPSTMPPRGIHLPEPMQYSPRGYPLLNLRPPTRPVMG